MGVPIKFGGTGFGVFGVVCGVGVITLVAVDRTAMFLLTFRGRDVGYVALITWGVSGSAPEPDVIQ